MMVTDLMVTDLARSATAVGSRHNVPAAAVVRDPPCASLNCASVTPIKTRWLRPGRCRPHPCRAIGVHARNKSFLALARRLQACRSQTALALALMLASSLCTVIAQTRAAATEDRFQLAVNYVFTGKLDPADAPQIVDRKSCVVLVPDLKFNRYARYYLSRFKMDTARISRKYAGAKMLYELEVEGDDVLLEYLKADKTTVDYGFRSAHISLPGDPDQTEKALALIFSQYCKVERPRSPF
jgi:hypothetical protein